MHDEGPGKRTLYILTAVFAAIFLTGYFLRHTFSALLTSLVLGYLLNPLLKYLEKRGLTRFTALVLLYGSAILAGLVIFFLITPYVVHQVEAFTTSFPHYVQNLKSAVDSWKLRVAPYYAGEEGAWLMQQGEQTAARLAEGLSSTGYKQIKVVFFGLFDLVVAPILVFLILYYKERFKTLIKRMVPQSERHRLEKLGKKINRSLERFILGMLLDCLLVGILTAAALYFLGIEFALLNGLFAGFASIVPFVGVMVAIIPAAFIGYAKSGDLTIIPKVFLAYFIIYVIIEGNLIRPLVMKRTLKLNPLVVIFAIMAMGETLGFWGIVLAVPLAAAIKICAAELREGMADDEHNLGPAPEAMRPPESGIPDKSVL